MSDLELQACGQRLAAEIAAGGRTAPAQPPTQDLKHKTTEGRRANVARLIAEVAAQRRQGFAASARKPPLPTTSSVRAEFNPLESLPQDSISCRILATVRCLYSSYPKVLISRYSSSFSRAVPVILRMSISY